MRAPCPACSATGRILVSLGWCTLDLGPCLPCRGKGRLRIISRAEYDLLAEWLPLDQVAAAKAQQRKDSPAHARSKPKPLSPPSVGGHLPSSRLMPVGMARGSGPATAGVAGTEAA